MSLGQKLLDLRKSKHLSQEEASEKLSVSRQTISKWETDQSTPDFDKIVPLCKLYGITPNELLLNETNISVNTDEPLKEDLKTAKKKKAKGISLGILLYFIAIIWVMITIPVLTLNPIIASAIMILICGIGTFVIVYTCLIYKDSKTKEETKESKLIKQISNILAIITLIIYLIISFVTMAWYITWIMWIVYALVVQIIKLIFILRSNDNEK